MTTNITPAAALARFNLAPLAMLNSEAQRIMSVLSEQLRTDGVLAVVSIEDLTAPYEVVIHDTPPEAVEARVPRLPKTDKGVAVIRVQGVIGQRRGGDYWAGTYSEDVDAQLRAMDANPQIGAIVMDYDTPGGITFGIPELADTINQVRQTTPVYSLANGCSASAGFWLSSQADKAFAAPSGHGVGSHGVISMHVDISKSLEEEGINVTLISSGKHKTEGNRFGPLPDEALAEIQRRNKRIFDDFTSALALGRHVSGQHVLDNFGQGRMIEADRAKSLGMIDGVATLNELLAGIIKPREGRGRSAAVAIAMEAEAGHDIGQVD